MKFESQLPGEGAGKLLIGVGLGAANLVIEVGDGEYQPQFLPQLKENAQQRDRVRAAGNSHGHAITRLKQPVFGGKPAYLLHHHPILPPPETPKKSHPGEDIGKIAILLTLYEENYRDHTRGRVRNPYGDWRQERPALQAVF